MDDAIWAFLAVIAGGVITFFGTYWGVERSATNKVSEILKTADVEMGKWRTEKRLELYYHRRQSAIEQLDAAADSVELMTDEELRTMKGSFLFFNKSFSDPLLTRLASDVSRGFAEGKLWAPEGLSKREELKSMMFAMRAGVAGAYDEKIEEILKEEGVS